MQIGFDAKLDYKIYMYTSALVNINTKQKSLWT